MQNKEFTFIGIGLAALGGIGYFFRQRHRESTAYKLKREELIANCQRESHPYLQLKQHDNLAITGLISGITQYQLEPTTYKKFMRHVAKGYKVPESPSDFQEHQCGGSFTINQPTNGTPLEVHINDCHIQQALLRTQKSKNITFAENGEKESFSYSLLHTLKPRQTIAIYGSISYSLTQGRWVVLPEFMLQEVSRSDAVKQMVGFLESKIDVCKFIKYALALMGCTVAYLLVYRPLKCLWRRSSSKYTEVSKGELDYFKLRENFGARREGALNCEQCHKSAIRIIYECGHLAYCEECHRQLETKQCPICHRVCSRFIKIFI